MRKNSVVIDKSQKRKMKNKAQLTELFVSSLCLLQFHQFKMALKEKC